jgi:murein DD-endopeptidase MepM/ murein hydrolase activator NlpD
MKNKIALIVTGILCSMLLGGYVHRDNIPNIRPYDYDKYGYRVSGKFGEDRGGSSHSGIDYSLCLRTSVNATADGMVVACRMFNGYGFTVIIDHGNNFVETDNATTITNYKSYYAHLDEPLVLNGYPVYKGDIIALSGNSGNVQCHLHYSVLKTVTVISKKTGKKCTTSGFVFPFIK